MHQHHACYCFVLISLIVIRNTTMKTLGKGIYTVPEACRLTGLSAQSIRRWIKRYKYKYHGNEKLIPKLWKPDFDFVDNIVELSFKDLMEIRYVKAYRDLGLNMKIIRYAKKYAFEEYHTFHPFCTQRFVTDGRKIFEEIINKSGKKLMMNILNKQTEYDRILSPFLKQLDFKNDEIIMWWPMTPKRQVVLDPSRSFGQPIVNKEGILTNVLASAYHANNCSYDIVSEWFEASKVSIRDAVEFEKNIAA